MRYNYHELDREDQWTIIELVTLAKVNVGCADVEDMDITLTVEGVELDILKLVDKLRSQMDRWVREEACSIVKGIGGDLIDTIDQAHQILLDRL